MAQHLIIAVSLQLWISGPLRRASDFLSPRFDCTAAAARPDGTLYPEAELLQVARAHLRGARGLCWLPQQLGTQPATFRKATACGLLPSRKLAGGTRDNLKVHRRFAR